MVTNGQTPFHGSGCLSRSGDGLTYLALSEHAGGKQTVLDADVAPLGLDAHALQQAMAHLGPPCLGDVTR